MSRVKETLPSYAPSAGLAPIANPPKTRSLTVAYAIASVNYGTGQWTMLRQLLEFSRKRWNSIVIAGQLRVADPEPLPAHVTFPRVYGLAPLDYELRTVLKFADIIHVKSGIPLYISSLLAGRPVLYTLHQPDPIWLHSGAMRVNRIGARLIEREWLLSRAAALTSVSEWVAEWYLRRRGVRSVVIPDAIDMNRFRNLRKRSRAGRLPRLLTVGDWDGFNGRKRTHELLPCLSELRKSIPSAQLTMVGLSESSEAALRTLSTKAGLNGAVILKRRLTQSELAEEYQLADVYVTASIVEGFYRPMIEAFASGLPTVARDPGSLVEAVCAAPVQHIRRSDGGVTFDGSPSDFVRAIQRTLDLYQSLSVNAQRYASQFDQARVLPMYARLYDDLMGW